MKKLATVIRYECVTSFKYIWIFYACMFGAIALVSSIISVSVDGSSNVGINGLEINSMIYLGILAVLGFQEDFKMLIQNGFTRKYIFLSTVSLFAFVAIIMALVDTLVGAVLHTVLEGYDSIFSSLYGNNYPFLLKLLWLFLIYMVVCCCIYLITLAIHKLEKTASILVGLILGFTAFLLVPVLFRFVFPKEFTEKFFALLGKGLGFVAGGSTNFFYPIALLILIAGIFAGCSYLVLRKTELKA